MFHDDLRTVVDEEQRENTQSVSYQAATFGIDVKLICIHLT
jgi:hypothetical protein